MRLLVYDSTEKNELRSCHEQINRVDYSYHIKSFVDDDNATIT